MSSPFSFPDLTTFTYFILTMVNIVLASSLRLINLSGQMSLAHGGMMTIGAYASALLVMKAGLSFWVAMPLRASATALIAYLVGFPFVRLKGIYFSIVTIFFGEVVLLTAQQWQSLTGGAAASSAFPVPNPVSFFGISGWTFLPR